MSDVGGRGRADVVIGTARHPAGSGMRTPFSRYSARVMVILLSVRMRIGRAD